jgi:hypothetical protein
MRYAAALFSIIHQLLHSIFSFPRLTNDLRSCATAHGPNSTKQGRLMPPSPCQGFPGQYGFFEHGFHGVSVSMVFD